MHFNKIRLFSLEEAFECKVFIGCGLQFGGKIELIDPERALKLFVLLYRLGILDWNVQSHVEEGCMRCLLCLHIEQVFLGRI